ncbi:hypothetical protein ACMHYB_25610 [Sorangium sp. So ce1128]
MNTPERAGALFLGLGVIVVGGVAMFRSINVNWGDGWGFLLVALLGYSALFLGYELFIRAAVNSGEDLGFLRSLFSIVISGLLTIPLIFVWMLALRSSRSWSMAVELMMLVVVLTGAAGVIGLIDGRRR